MQLIYEGDVLGAGLRACQQIRQLSTSWPDHTLPRPPETLAGVLAVLRPAAGARGEEESARGPAPRTYLTLSVLRKGKSQFANFY